MLPKLRISFFLLQQFLFPCFVAKNIATPRHCVASSCGTIPNISYPFRLKDDPHHCGNHSYELVCEENTTIAYINHHKYSVRAINYNNYTIRLVDYSITNSTCSFPTNVSLGPFSFPSGSPYTTKFNDYHLTESINFISCPYPVNASDLTEIDSCTKKNQSGDDDPGKRYTYIKFAHLNGLDVKNMCTIEVVVMTSLKLGKKARVSLSEVHASLLYGFELSWLPLLCGADCYGDCWLIGIKPGCPYPIYGYYPPTLTSIFQRQSEDVISAAGPPYISRNPSSEAVQVLRPFFCTIGKEEWLFEKYITETESTL